MMDVSCFQVGFSMDSNGRLTMTVTARYISVEPVDGVYQHDSMVLLKTPYVCYDNTYSKIANLCIPNRFSGVKHFDVFEPCFWSDKPKALYEIGYGFVYADGIKAMKAALDSYGISWDYHVLGLDDLPI